MVVILAISIMASLALPSFTVSKEMSLNKEANMTLKLIQSAERIYRIENDYYANCSSISSINTNLRLYIPTSANRNWNYSVSVSGSNFTASATRLGGNNRTYTINKTAEDPTTNASSEW